jgi:hypothetical protein
MRLTVRVLLLTIAVSLGVREGGDPNSDTLALELRTQVAMTPAGLVIQAVLVPAAAGGTRHVCVLPAVRLRENETQREVIDAVVNRAAECALRSSQ